MFGDPSQAIIFLYKLFLAASANKIHDESQRYRSFAWASSILMSAELFKRFTWGRIFISSILLQLQSLWRNSVGNNFKERRAAKLSMIWKGLTQEEEQGLNFPIELFMLLVQSPQYFIMSSVDIFRGVGLDIFNIIFSNFPPQIFKVVKLPTIQHLFCLSFQFFFLSFRD